MKREWVFLIILIVNLIITVVYVIFNIVRKPDNRRGFWMRAIIMLFCPITGALMFLFGWIWFHVFFHAEVDLEDVVFSKDRVRTFMHADEERERNLVPLEEAIVVTDHDNLRSLMLSVASGDTQQSLSTIALALNSDDTEAAHYAASILQDELDDYRSNVQKAYLYMKEDKEDWPQYAHQVIFYMDQVLKQQVFTEMEQTSQVNLLEEIGEMLYEKESERMTSSEFEVISLRLLEMGDYERCRKWCDRAALHYPNTLATYTCELKLYYTMEDREMFFKVLNDLRQSGVVFDRETVEMVRVFM